MGRINIIKLIIYHDTANSGVWGTNTQDDKEGDGGGGFERNCFEIVFQGGEDKSGRYLFFMRRTTPRKMMTKRRIPAMTPAILTVWSVCFSGSTALGLWVAAPARTSQSPGEDQMEKSNWQRCVSEG